MKYLKMFLFAVLIVSAMVVSGCGGGDKFAGDWVKMSDSGDRADVISIEKNGDSYIVKIGKSYWVSEKFVKTGKKIKWGKYKQELDVRDIVLSVERSYGLSSKLQQYPAKKDGENRLVLDIGFPIAVSYVEKDGTILFDSKTYKKAKDLAEVKATLKKKALERVDEHKKKLENKEEFWGNPSETINEIKFVDGDPDKEPDKK